MEKGQTGQYRFIRNIIMSTHEPHPSVFITPEQTAILRDNAAEAEGLGQLHPAQLSMVHQLQWFKLLAPKVYGGLETSLPNLVRLQEAISWADGSFGWVITLCCGAGWFGGFMEPGTAMQIFNTPGLCLAGSGAVSGEAEIIDDGYRLNGTWKYASGAYHATHFTANCLIKQNGQTLNGPDGQPLVIPFIIDKSNVTLSATWKYVGMIATGSHSFTMDNVVVSGHRSFCIDAKYAQVDGTLYQYPFLQLAEATLAVNLSGMAMHFIDLCKEIFKKKINEPKLTEIQKERLKVDLSDTINALQSARDALFGSVDASWAKSANNQTDELKAVTQASRHLAITARQAVDGLYPYCGLMAAAPNTEINRVWRDIHTAGQHSLLTFEE
jgi:alkylation response protein AidB-like acyl-CoA dehydrogenase